MSGTGEYRHGRSGAASSTWASVVSSTSTAPGCGRRPMTCPPASAATSPGPAMQERRRREDVTGIVVERDRQLGGQPRRGGRLRREPGEARALPGDEVGHHRPPSTAGAARSAAATANADGPPLSFAAWKAPVAMVVRGAVVGADPGLGSDGDERGIGGDDRRRVARRDHRQQDARELERDERRQAERAPRLPLHLAEHLRLGRLRARGPGLVGPARGHHARRQALERRPVQRLGLGERDERAGREQVVDARRLVGHGRRDALDAAERRTVEPVDGDRERHALLLPGDAAARQHERERRGHGQRGEDDVAVGAADRTQRRRAHLLVLASTCAARAGGIAGGPPGEPNVNVSSKWKSLRNVSTVRRPWIVTGPGASIVPSRRTPQNVMPKTSTSNPALTSACTWKGENCTIASTSRKPWAPQPAALMPASKWPPSCTVFDVTAR